MKISKKEIEKIAHLARLKVDDHLIEKYARQISDILQYIDKLKNADVAGAGLVSDASFNENVFREKSDRPSLSGPDITLSNAPEKENNFFIVPRTVK